jgi:hypothetical protein
MNSNLNLREKILQTTEQRMIQENLVANRLIPDRSKTRPYVVNEILSSVENPFKRYFDLMTNIFPKEDYDIWIKHGNYQGREIGVGVVKKSDNPVAVTVWLKRGFPIDNPLGAIK